MLYRRYKLVLGRLVTHCTVLDRAKQFHVQPMLPTPTLPLTGEDSVELGNGRGSGKGDDNTGSSVLDSNHCSGGGGDGSAGSAPEHTSASAPQRGFFFGFVDGVIVERTIIQLVANQREGTAHEVEAVRLGTLWPP
jgi:hypothetical protein